MGWGFSGKITLSRLSQKYLKSGGRLYLAFSLVSSSHVRASSGGEVELHSTFSTATRRNTVVPRWWNELPSTTRVGATLSTFKKLLKTQLFREHLPSSLALRLVLRSAERR